MNKGSNYITVTDMATYPLVSIVVPVYNAGKYLKETIQSLLNQTYSNFELIAIDDGSTDNSLQILRSFEDPRLRILQNEQNRGIVYTRNRGLKEIRGKYYAPFDADDIAHPTKLEKQIQFMEANPTFGMIGSWVILIDEKGKELPKKWKLKAQPELIPSILMYKNYFAQSALLIRTEAIPIEGYPDYSICQDYGMWCDIAKRWKTWNLPQFLIQYRIHGNGITRNSERLKKEHFAVAYANINTCGFDISTDEIKSILPEFLEPNSNKYNVSKAKDSIIKLLVQNQTLQAQPQNLFWKATWFQWLRICYGHSKVNPLFKVPWFTIMTSSCKIIMDNFKIVRI
jgi:glycosyltransferase involved in cell wall biosynthesis